MVAICPNPYRDLNLELTRQCVRILREAGYECVICPVFTGSGWTAPKDMDKKNLCNLSDVLTELSAILVLGGEK